MADRAHFVGYPQSVFHMKYAHDFLVHGSAVHGYITTPNRLIWVICPYPSLLFPWRHLEKCVKNYVWFVSIYYVSNSKKWSHFAIGILCIKVLPIFVQSQCLMLWSSSFVSQAMPLVRDNCSFKQQSTPWFPIKLPVCGMKLQHWDVDGVSESWPQWC